MKKRILILSSVCAMCFLASCGKDPIADLEDRLQTLKDAELRSEANQYLTMYRRVKSGGLGTSLAVNRALVGAAAFNDLKGAEYFISQGADVESEEAKSAAARAGNYEVLKLLWKKGADIRELLPDVFSGQDWICSMAEEDWDLVRAVRVFSRKSSPKDSPEKIRKQMQDEYEKIFIFLLDNGADVNLGLRAAVKGGNVKAVKELLRRGANANAKIDDDSRLTLLKYAQYDCMENEDQKAVVELLLAAGAKE